MLDELLQEWSVLPPGQWENDIGPRDWFAVANDAGIAAYFAEEKDAFAFRLHKINCILNA